MPFQYQYQVDCLSDLGKTREINQDSVLAASLKNQFHDAASTSAFLAVADGVGGAPAGEVASRIAIESLYRRFTDLMLSKGGADADVAAILRQSFQHSHEEVVRASIANPKYSGMATTLCAAYLSGSTGFIGSIGDSRCYLVRTGRIRQLSRDQAQGNLLHQAIGARVTLSSVAEEIVLENNDTILLCSDGLSNMVPDQIIADVVATSPAPSQACRKLVEEANSRGGADNIGVAIGRVSVTFQ